MNPEMRVTDEELAIIKGTFANNTKLLKLMRKIFLPEVTIDSPIGQVVDLWMTTKVDDMSTEAALINLKARNGVINHVESCLMQLHILAGATEETVEQTKARLLKNSAK